MISSRSTPESRTALQGRNEGGKGAQFPGRRITMGAPKIPTVSHALSSMQYICFRKTSGSNAGAKVASCPVRHLTSLRLGCTGSMPETGFWLCKFRESCVSYKFSIAFLFALLLFLSKLPSSSINKLLTKIYLHSSVTSPELC